MTKLLVLPEASNSSSFYQVNPVLCLSKNQTDELDFLLGEEFFLKLMQVQEGDISNHKVEELEALRNSIKDTLVPLCRNYKKEYRKKKEDPEFTSPLLEDLARQKRLVLGFNRKFNRYITVEKKLLETKRREEKRKQTDLDSFLILIDENRSSVRRFFNLTKEQKELCNEMKDFYVPEELSGEDVHSYILALAFYIKSYQQKEGPDFFLNRTQILSQVKQPWVDEEQRDKIQRMLRGSLYPGELVKVEKQPKYSTFVPLEELNPLLKFNDQRMEALEQKITSIYSDLEFQHFQRLFNLAEGIFKEYSTVENDQKVSIITGVMLDDFYLLRDVLRQKIVHCPKESSIRSFFQKFSRSLAQIEDQKIFYEIEPVIVKREKKEFQERYKKLVMEDKNFIDVQALLRGDRKLLTLKSENQQRRLFFYDVLDHYFNLLLNAREDHPDIPYFTEVVSLYLREIDFRKEKVIQRSVNGKLERFIFKLCQSGFDPSRIQRSFELMQNLYALDKKKISKNGHLSRLERKDTFFHRYNDSYTFTLDKTGTKLFEQAFSFNETETGYELGIYISDVTSVDTSFQTACKNGMNGRKTVSCEKRKDINLKEGNRADVIGFHFLFNEQREYQSFSVKKEKVCVQKNIFFGKSPLSDDTLQEITPELCQTVEKTVQVKELLPEFTSFMLDPPVQLPSQFVSKNIERIITAKAMLFLDYTLAAYSEKEHIPVIRKFVYKDQIGEDGKRKRLSEFSLQNTAAIQGKELRKKINELEKSYRASFYYIDPKAVKATQRYASFSAPMRDVSAFFNLQLFNEYYFHSKQVENISRISDEYELSKIVFHLNDQIQPKRESLENQNFHIKTAIRKHRMESKQSTFVQKSESKPSTLLIQPGVETVDPFSILNSEVDQEVDTELVKQMKKTLVVPKWN